MWNATTIWVSGCFVSINWHFSQCESHKMIKSLPLHFKLQTNYKCLEKSFNVLKKNGNKLKRCNCAGNHCCKCCRHVIFFPTGMLLRHSCKYCGNGGQSTNEVDNASSLCCQCTLLDRLVDNIIFSICIMYIAILLILISVFWLKWNEHSPKSRRRWTGMQTW